jgi:hypothetical protein
MSRTDPYRRKRAALAGILNPEDELPPEYYERAVQKLMGDSSEQRDFVWSEFMDTGVIRQMLAGTTSPAAARKILLDQFDAWLRDHRKFRVITTAWELYGSDHPATAKRTSS